MSSENMNNLNGEDFVDKCFLELKNKIGNKRYVEFVRIYKFVDLTDDCFIFSTKDKSIYDEYVNTPNNDEIFDILIAEIAIKLNKKINGFSLRLENN